MMVADLPQQWCTYVHKLEDIYESTKNKCTFVDYHGN